MTDNTKAGIYIHVPFCRRKCLYCDFVSRPECNCETFRKYTDRLISDIKESGKTYGKIQADTVFFGGGTPTLLPPDMVGEILSAVRECFELDENSEITSECNPGTIDFDYLKKIREFGINRLSVGVQSADDGELEKLGRIHRFADAEECIKSAKLAGFDNISADLMYGIPNQTLESFEKSIRTVCSLGINHLSAYCLQIEENTPFYKLADSLNLPCEDELFEMYLVLERVLKEFSMSRYEISNYSEYGCESRHNIKYWTRAPYLGFGPAAYSFFGGQRFNNSSDIAAWLGGNSIQSEKVTVTNSDAETEYIMLGMRLAQGIDVKEFDRLFPSVGGFEEKYGAKLEKYADQGLVLNNSESVKFTTKGFFVSNTVLSDILEFN